MVSRRLCLVGGDHRGGGHAEWPSSGGVVRSPGGLLCPERDGGLVRSPDDLLCPERGGSVVRSPERGECSSSTMSAKRWWPPSPPSSHPLAAVDLELHDGNCMHIQWWRSCWTYWFSRFSSSPSLWRAPSGCRLLQTACLR